MAYSTNSEVTDEFKNIDTTGLITTGKIDTWILQADAFINSRIGLLYSVPVASSATESILILKEISIGLVAQRIADIMATKSIVPQGDQAIPKDLIEKSEKRLDMIVARQMLLSDATVLSNAQGVKSHSSENIIKRTFDQSKEQW